MNTPTEKTFNFMNNIAIIELHESDNDVVSTGAEQQTHESATVY